MNNITETRILPYSILELFDLVIDVEKYPEFIPWVVNTKILSTTGQEIIADMTVKFLYITRSYRSQIKYEILDNTIFIEVLSISGPFKKLYNLWKFSDNNGGTLIEFNIDFAFKASLLNKISTSVFQSVVQKIITAFENRALEKYASNKNLK